MGVFAQRHGRQMRTHPFTPKHGKAVPLGRRITMSEADKEANSNVAYSSGHGIGVGVAIGAALGASYGASSGDMAQSVAMGVALGTAIGAIFDVIQRQRAKVTYFKK